MSHHDGLATQDYCNVTLTPYSACNTHLFGKVHLHGFPLILSDRIDQLLMEICVHGYV